MFNRALSFVGALLTILCLVAVIGCGSGSSGNNTTTPPPPPAVTINPAAVTLGPGQSFQFNVVGSGTGTAPVFQVNGTTGGSSTPPERSHPADSTRPPQPFRQGRRPQRSACRAQPAALRLRSSIPLVLRRAPSPLPIIRWSQPIRSPRLLARRFASSSDPIQLTVLLPLQSPRRPSEDPSQSWWLACARVRPTTCKPSSN